MIENKPKIVRVTTIVSSLGILLKGQLAFMNTFYEVIGITSNDPWLKEVSKREGVKTVGIDMTRKITPLKDLKALWQLYRLFKKEKPEIVHTHTPKAGTLGLLAAYFARVPIRLHTIAGLPLMEVSGSKRVLLNFVEKITYSCATKLYPNSHGLNEFVKKEGFTTENKLKVIGHGSSNGIDINHFDPRLFTELDKLNLRKSLRINSKERLFIYIGRIVKDKGIHELIGAFSTLCEEFKNVTLLIAGLPEKQLDPISQKTENILNTHPKIKILGWLEDIRPYLAISELMVFPSYREGFPNVVMQAGAMGLPVIASDINGCNEIIIDGENGLIIPPKDTKELTKAMTNYLQNSEICFSPEKCRQLIADRYDQRLIWKLLHEEYEHLLNRIQN